MIGRLLLRVILVAVLAAVMPCAVWAQNPRPASQDTTELSFEREVFSYPQYARRNPFAPLLSAEGGGPRFERLILLGILYAPDGENSLALFGEGTRTTVSETEISVEVTGATYRLRIGETVGNTTIREIQRHHVVVAVEEFGLIETRIVELPNRTAGQGGPE